MDRTARTLIAGRALRGFVDGSVAVLLPAYLLALGHDSFAVGVIGTVTLLGSALATLAVGAWGHRVAPRTLLLSAALLMAATGAGFAGFSAFAPLLVVAFIGTPNGASTYPRFGHYPGLFFRAAPGLWTMRLDFYRDSAGRLGSDRLPSTP